MIKQERALRTHELLLDASADEFVRHGYAGANLQRIAGRTGMTKGALYAHFASKQQLAAALTTPFDQAWREVLDLVEQVDEGNRQPLTALRCITFNLVGLLHSCLRFRAGLHLVLEEARARCQPPDVITDLTRALTRLVDEAQRAGQLEQDHEPAAVSSFVIASVIGTYYTAVAEARLDTLPDRVEDIWHLVMPPPVCDAQPG
ncbi:TetR/AcrR family transcriptional regulator [Kitasatospora sp. NBC_01560]|uniref:TetR family transcriptional regulator n=1 Tax=Kitasatospora sp. NBC_01560 TaxID=2975965 RepID=UPI003870608A